jgi:Na+/proline symporter
MSTVSSGVNSMAAVFTVDFWRAARRENASDPEQVGQGVGFTAVSGVLITAIAVGLAPLLGKHNLIDLMQKAFNFLLGPLGGLFFIGMFLSRCRARSAVSATLLGLAFGVLLAWGDQVLRISFSPYWAIALPCAVTVGAGAVAGLAEPPPERGTWLTWWAVVRRESPVPEENP